MKRAINDYGLADGLVLRTKVECLDLCCDGPVAVVYPEGTWYSGLTADRIPRFVRDHLVGGCPVAEWVFAHNPLSAGLVIED